MTSVWMFARPPIAPSPGIVTVPVICPKPIATRVNLAECEDRQPRVFGEHIVSNLELRGWRWVAAQVYPQFDGWFPWELEARTVYHA